MRDLPLRESRQQLEKALRREATRPAWTVRRGLARTLAPAVVLLAVTLLSGACANTNAGTRTAAPTDQPQLARVLMQTTLGRIVVEVDEGAAPVTAANFLAYVDQRLFAGAHFYRVVTMGNQPNNDVKIEVIQGGLGFEEADRRPPIDHETTAETGLRHFDGTISMARLEPGTASSEFFICVGDQPELDFGGRRNPDGQGFAAFGRVVEGLDVVRAIQRGRADGQMLVETVDIVEMRRFE